MESRNKMPMNEHLLDDAAQHKMQMLVKIFSRHLVLFGGEYIQLDEKGRQIGEERFYSHSGFVVSLSGEWHIVTAGHIFTETEEKLATGRVKIVSQTLSDRYGLGATHEHA